MWCCEANEWKVARTESAITTEDKIKGQGGKKKRRDAQHESNLRKGI